MRWLSLMCLARPGTVLWDEENSEPRFLTEPGWVQLADDGFCDSLYVDRAGACWLRSKLVDEKNRRIHDSFDAWMAETAMAVRSGRVRIVDGSIHCGDLAFEADPMAEPGWA